MTTQALRLGRAGAPVQLPEMKELTTWQKFAKERVSTQHKQTNKPNGYEDDVCAMPRHATRRDGGGGGGGRDAKATGWWAEG